VLRVTVTIKITITITATITITSTLTFILCAGWPNPESRMAEFRGNNPTLPRVTITITITIITTITITITNNPFRLRWLTRFSRTER
jgi:hypothetical protein